MPTTFGGGVDTTVTKIKVYPNPFTSFIVVQLPSGEKMSGIQVYDLLGRSIYVSSDTNTTIQLKIPNGFYIMRVTSITGKRFTAKIIKKN